MNKREWTIVIGTLLGAWLFDWVTKLSALDLRQSIAVGPFLFSLHQNPGAMMGMFSDLPAFLRIVSLSTAGAILVCVYMLLQYLLPLKSMMLRVGLSFLVGGIMGNVTDRIIWGYVIDFFIVHVRTFYSPAFNMADAIQWVGYAFILIAMIRDGDLLWPQNDARRKYWINFRFQFKYSMVLFAAGFTLSLVTFVFGYTFLKVSLQEVAGPASPALTRYLYPFVITFSLIVVGFSVAFFTVGKLISHRIAGPLYAFEKHIRDNLAKANDEKSRRVFKLRQYDEFKNLEKLAEDINSKLG